MPGSSYCQCHFSRGSAICLPTHRNWNTGITVFHRHHFTGCQPNTTLGLSSLWYPLLLSWKNIILERTNTRRIHVPSNAWSFYTGVSKHHKICPVLVTAAKKKPWIIYLKHDRKFERMLIAESFKRSSILSLTFLSFTSPAFHMHKINLNCHSLLP